MTQRKHVSHCQTKTATNSITAKEKEPADGKGKKGEEGE